MEEMQKAFVKAEAHTRSEFERLLMTGYQPSEKPFLAMQAEPKPRLRRVRVLLCSVCRALECSYTLYVDAETGDVLNKGRVDPTQLSEAEQGINPKSVPQAPKQPQPYKPRRKSRVKLEIYD